MIGTRVSTAGGTDRYEHSQGTALAEWVITHNLGRTPFAVHVLSTSGDDVVGDVLHTDANTTTITFSAAFAGSAILGA